MIVVTGGAGVMGSRLVRGLCEKGEKVRVVTLPNDPGVERLEGLNCEIVYADVSDPEGVVGVCDGVKTVYHLAAVIIARDHQVFERVNVRGTHNLLQGSIKANVEHFIFVSSISVTYPVSTPYSLSKKECERMIVGQDEVKWTIVRPALAYDGNGGQEFVMFKEALLRYPLAFLVGRGDAIKNPVHTSDLMQGFMALPANEKAYNKIYNFCGGQEITVRELAKLILELHNARKPIVPVPVPICRMIAAVTGSFMKTPPLTMNGIVGLIQNANPDWSEAQRDLGYNPIDVRQGLRQCLQTKLS